MIYLLDERNMLIERQRQPRQRMYNNVRVKPTMNQAQRVTTRCKNFHNVLCVFLYEYDRTSIVLQRTDSQDKTQTSSISGIVHRAQSGANQKHPAYESPSRRYHRTLLHTSINPQRDRYNRINDSVDYVTNEKYKRIDGHRYLRPF